MAGDNTAQIQEWNGVLGDRWAAQQAEMDEIIRPFGEAALRAANVQPGERVLDVGCGCGDTSLALVEAVGPVGLVLGVDVSAPMLAVAQTRARGLTNLTFMTSDAATAALPEGLDLIYSRFGVMFFDDPVAAFRHMRGFLKPAGRLAFACWQPARDNAWASIPVMAARKALGLDPPAADPHAPGPFAFADPARVAGILTAAGFANTIAQPYEHPVKLGSNPRSAADGASRMGPLHRLIRETSPDRVPEILEAVEKALAPLAAPDGLVAPPGRTWIVTANAA